MRFENRNVYISGGSSGIGLSAARKLSSLGANVFIFSIDDRETLDQALEVIRGAKRSDGQRFDAIRLDVADNDEVQKKLGAAAASFGNPHVLVNSAGMGGAFYFEDVSHDRFDRTIRTNLYGTRNVVSALVPFMREGGGYIVNVSSISGLIGVFGHTAYGASKFAVTGFSESLRSELKRFGIRVSVLCPGQVDTPLWNRANENRPPETMAVNSKSGLMHPDRVAEALIKGMDRGGFLIIPGWRGKFIHMFNRIFPGLRERLADRAVRKAQSKTARG